MAKLTTLCYLEQNYRYLLLHRTKKDADDNRGKWIGVGGKFEDGESPEDCMLREVKEETGLTVTEYRYRGIITFVSDICPTEYMHLFTATAWTGKLADCDEGELAWIPKSGLGNLPMWEGDRVFLDLLNREIPFFSLKLTYTGEHLAAAVLNGKKIAV